jgi:hypothetical protein
MNKIQGPGQPVFEEEFCIVDNLPTPCRFALFRAVLSEENEHGWNLQSVTLES